MNVNITGLPFIAIAVGFIVVFSAPVWLAAKMVGASYPTMLRSFFSLVIAIVATLASAAVAGGAAIFLAPLSFLLSFKFVLGTSMFGALMLSILAFLGYLAMVQFIGGGISFTNNGAPV